MRHSIALVTERNAALHNAMKDVEDYRERMLKAASTGRHEPSSMYGGLYDVEELDEGGDLIERRERSAKTRFIPVSELPESLEPAASSDDEELELETESDLSDLVEEPTEDLRIQEIRYLESRSRLTTVILRRRTALQAL